MSTPDPGAAPSPNPLTGPPVSVPRYVLAAASTLILLLSGGAGFNLIDLLAQNNSAQASPTVEPAIERRLVKLEETCVTTKGLDHAILAHERQPHESTRALILELTQKAEDRAVTRAAAQLQVDLEHQAATLVRIETKLEQLDQRLRDIESRPATRTYNPTPRR